MIVHSIIYTHISAQISGVKQNKILATMYQDIYRLILVAKQSHLLVSHDTR